MDPEKVSTILDWQTPQPVGDVQSFVEFASFYRRFIHNFSKRTKLLSDMTKVRPIIRRHLRKER